MSIRHIERLFQPRSIVVVGASDRPNTAGQAVYASVLAGHYAGEIHAVNPRHGSVRGLPVRKRISDLSRDDIEQIPDLALVCSPVRTLVEVVEDLGELGCRVVMLMTPLGADEHLQANKVSNDLLEVAGRYGLRLLGPGSAGLVIPELGLNASPVEVSLEPGTLAFVSQSSGLALAVHHWAVARGIGFSKFLALGDSLDVDLADVIDFLGMDSATKSILICQSVVEQGRKYLSALRAAARNKPLLVVKSDRMDSNLASERISFARARRADQVFDTALRRSGALRVPGIEDLFSAAELLAHTQAIAGPKLGILTNSLGAGLLTRDALHASNEQAVTWSDASRSALLEISPQALDHADLVVLNRRTEAEDVKRALMIMTADPATDAVVLVLAPTLAAESEALALAAAEICPSLNTPVLGCFLGGDPARRAMQVFNQAELPSFTSPEDVVTAVARLDDYRCNQLSLTEIPESDPANAHLNQDRISQIIDQESVQGGLANGETTISETTNSETTSGKVNDEGYWLNEVQSKALLREVDIPCIETRIVQSPDEAVVVAGELGFPVALKAVLAEEISALDVGLFSINLDDAAAVRSASEALARRVRHAGYSQIAAYAVQPMADRPEALNLFVGMHVDHTFGPVISFGHGGNATEAIADQAFALPPLNKKLATELIQRTRVARLMAGYRNTSAVANEAVAEIIVRLSELALAEPRIASIRVNPLLADVRGAVALDARIKVLSENEQRTPSAIAPYPSIEREKVDFHGQMIELRPIRPEDAYAHAEFFNSLESEDRRLRFFGVIRSPDPSQLARFTQIDYDREMAFIARELESPTRTLGVVRVALDRARETAEFAIVVRSDLKGGGLGRQLLKKMINYCRRIGVKRLIGQVMQNNDRMLHLARSLGFAVAPADQGVHETELEL